MKNKQPIKNLLIVFGLLALVGFFAYSLIEYQKSGIAQGGVVTCANGQCFWSAHIHTDIQIQVCGKEYPLAKFKGSLSDVHTHREETVIHWHDKLLYNPENKSFLESSPFVLKATLENQGIKLSGDKFLDKKDGDLCDGKKSAWKVFINGTYLSDWLNYEWKDRDIVLFVFDERAAEEVEKELRQNSIKFSPVGEG